MTAVLPEIHDGELRRVDIPGDRTLSLTFETIDKQLRSVILEGVEHFRCDNLLAGNIVFDIQKIADPDLDDLARVTGMEESASEKGRQYLRDCHKAIKQGELLFLKLQSSYGCEIGALCRGYRTG